MKKKVKYVKPKVEVMTVKLENPLAATSNATVSFGEDYDMKAGQRNKKVKTHLNFSIMKNTIIKTYKYSILIFYFALISCSKNEIVKSYDSINVPEGYISMSFEPQVSEETQEDILDKQSNTKLDTKVVKQDNRTIYTPIMDLELFDYRAGLKVVKNFPTGKNKLSTITPSLNRMSPGTKYMVLIYDENDNFIPEIS